MWERKGRITGHRLSGTFIVYRLADVEALLSDASTAPSPVTPPEPPKPKSARRASRGAIALPVPLSEGDHELLASSSHYIIKSALEIMRRARLQEIASQVRRRRYVFDLKEWEWTTFDLILCVTLDRGLTEKFVPYPQRLLADILGIPDKDFQPHVHSLRRMSILDVDKDSRGDGIIYRPQTNLETGWKLVPTKKARKLSDVDDAC